MGIDLSSLRQKENEKIYEEERYVRQQSLNIKENRAIFEPQPIKESKSFIQEKIPDREEQRYGRQQSFNINGSRSLFEPQPLKESKSYIQQKMPDREEFERRFQERKRIEERQIRQWAEERRKHQELEEEEERKGRQTDEELEQEFRLKLLKDKPTGLYPTKTVPIVGFNGRYPQLDPDQRKVIEEEIYEEIRQSQPSAPDFMLSSQRSPRRFKPDKYLISRVKEFSGEKGDNLENFFYTLERYFKNDDVPESYKVNIAADHLTKNALETFKMTSKVIDLSYTELKELLRGKFQPADHQAALRRELTSLKQEKSRNVTDYIYEFEKLMNQLTGMTELDKAGHFLEGLPRNIEKYVNFSGKVNTLMEVEREALRVETIFASENRNQKPSRSFDNRESYNNQKHSRNYENRESAEVHANNDKGPTQTDRAQSTWNSNRNQFEQKNIPEKVHNSHSGQIKLPMRENKRDNICFKCKEPREKGHQCNKNTKIVMPTAMIADSSESHKIFQSFFDASSISLLRCEITIEEETFRCAIDSGATMSIISTQVVNKHKLPMVTDPSTTVSLANGAKVPAKKTRPLAVCLQNRFCRMQFLVLPHEHIDVIIGLDWLSYFNASIDLSTHILKLPSEVVMLKEDETGDAEHDIAIAEMFDEDEYQEAMTWDSDTTETGLDVIKKQYDPSQGDNPDYIKLWELIIQNAELFAVNNNELGNCLLEPITINTGDTKPIYQHPYRKSLKERDAIRKEVKEMLRAGIIRESRSPWASPVVMVIKSDGSYRFCSDYRKINANTVNDAYPLPRISDILDRLRGSILFSTLDLKAGFWQLPMAEDSIAKTAFNTPDGLYEFIKAPFGLKNLPAEFSRRMRQVLGDLSFIEIYLDDLCCHSKSFQEHVQHLAIVFERLKQYGLKLNAKKCVFMARSVRLLGHVISADGVAMDPTKIEAVKNMKYCKNVKQVQQYLGLCGYYRRFVKDFAKIVQPLNNLIKKETKWHFGEECIQAFETLRTALMQQPILRQADLSLPFTLYTDVRGFAIGCILSQVDEKGAEYVCEYASRLLKGAETNYSVSEKECLGVLWGIQHFRVYLHGTKFRVVTDHKALHWLMTITDHTGRLARWSIYLTPYDFEIIHRKGAIHNNVDTLSRPVLFANATKLITAITDSSDENQRVEIKEPEDSIEKSLDIFEDEYAMHYLKFGRHKTGSSNNQVKRVEKIAKTHKMVENTIYYKHNDKWLIVPPKNERQTIVTRCHLIGHFGEKTTLERVRDKYFWKGITRDVERTIAQCTSCIRHAKRPAVHHPAQALRIHRIFDRWGMDLVHGLPETKRGNKSLIVITEYLSKWPYAAAIQNKSAEAVAPHLRNILFTFGPMTELLTDCGREFVNETIDLICRNVGVEHRVTSPYRPSTNGQCERLNATLIQCIKKHAEKNPTDWDLWIPYVLMAYRTRLHSSTGFTPYELMFGRSMNEFEDYQQVSDKKLLEIRASEIKDLVENKHPLARDTIERKQEYQKEIQDKRNQVQDKPLEKGTKVTIKVLKLQGKINPNYLGTYTVGGQTKHGNYYLENDKGKRLAQAYPLDRLKVITSEIDPKSDASLAEEIIDARFRHGIWEYLTKWPESQEKVDTWVAENDFNNTQIIESYWNKEKEMPASAPISEVTTHQINMCQLIEEPSLQEKKTKKTVTRENLNPKNNTYFKRERPNKKSGSEVAQMNTSTRLTQATWWNFLIPILFVIFMCPKRSKAFLIKDNFMYCETHNNPAIWDLPDSCRIQPRVEKTESLYYYSILSQLTQVVSGSGWFCSKTRHEVRTYKNLFTFTSRETDQFVMEVTKEDCEEMVKTKRCEGGKMKCVGDYCELLYNPNFEYQWMTFLNKTVYSCTMYPQSIHADSATSSMIISAQLVKHCQAREGSCLMNQGIMIWSTDIIKTCPFTNVQTLKLKHLGNALVNDNENKYFQIIEEVKICSNITAYKTTEGFYLTIDESAYKLPRTESDIKMIDGLILSEMDFQNHEVMQVMATLTKLTNQKICQLYKSFINIYTKLDDEFFSFTDINGNEAILYSDMSRVFVPHCIKVEEIEILEETENCYKDFAVRAKVKNETINAFLTNDKIIRTTSKVTTCKNHHQLIHLQKSHRVIKMRNNRITIEPDEHYVHLKVNILDANISKINYHHDDAIINSVEIIKKVANISKIVENNHEFHVMETAESENKETMNLLVKEVGDSLLKIGVAITSVAYLFLNPLLIIGCAVLICACRYTKQAVVAKPGRAQRYAGQI